MTLPQIISRNQIQKIPEIQIQGRVVIQPEVWYTCPAGKKAVMKGRIQCTGLGTAANASVQFAAVTMYTWLVTADNFDYLIHPRTLSVADNQMAFFEDVQLAAGDTMETVQDSGTNSEFNVWAQVTETPA